MKLNTKNTVLIGFAFLSICAFWQMYDGIIPKILTETFHMSETLSGAIMAADNVLALFLLPIFGGISDRCTSSIGKRRPFIFAGTLLAVSLMLLLPLLDNSYYAQPAAYKLILFVCVLGLILVAMGTYRSPAVALMPDVTPKPLRSKGNAIINLMGAVGGILYLLITTVLYAKSRTEGLDHISYLPLFAIVACIMLLALFVVMGFVNEPKLAREQAEFEAAHPEYNLAEQDDETHKAVLPKPVKRSLVFLLLSIAFWYIGYNAVSTWFTTYAGKMWNMEIGQASLCLTIATAGAIVTYIPAGALAGRLGRNKTIKIGVALLAACFFAGFLFTVLFDVFHPILLVLFTLVGVAWAMINVNSLPMVVEMCAGSDVGKFTGLYYTFSMSAQTVTPILSGFLLKNVGYRTLFIYSAIFVTLSFVTMCFVRHGDNKAEIKRGLEAFDIED